MNKKILLLPFFWIPTFFSAFSQTNQVVTQEEFVYKKVSDCEIKATIFLPVTSGPHPVVVYFHGGGFMFGNRDQGLNNFLRDELLNSGYAVVSADYRLAPETKLKEIMKDVGDVVKWLKDQGEEKYPIHTKKIGVIGGSAGGYLALSTAFNSESAPDAIVSISSPTGFTASVAEVGDTSLLRTGPFKIVEDSVVSYGDYSGRMDLWRYLAQHRLLLYGIFGFDPATEAEKLESFRLTQHVNSDFPPTLLIHARNDRLVDLRQVEDFYAFLKEKKARAELFVVENGHSNELLNQNPQAISRILSFLRENLE